MIYIKPADRKQLSIFNSLEDSVADNNIVRIIDLVVDKIVLSNPEKFKREIETEVGRPAYGSPTMLKLYLYGYLNGISSSRKLEKETARNIDVMWLLGNLRPDHWTISNYRKERADEIKLVTREFRRFLKQRGYIKGETVAIDGTKVKANANRDMLTIRKIENRLKNLKEKIDNYLEKMTKNDAIDDIEEEIGGEITGEKIDKELLKKLIEAQKKIEKLEKEKEYLEKGKIKAVSPNDRDARLMKTRDGKLAAHNVQFVVDQENKLIADSEVVSDENDLNQLATMVESIEEEIGKRPEEVIADKGYYNTSIIEKVESTGETECYVDVKERKEEEIKFTYEKEKDEYKCSEGKRLVLKARGKKREAGRTADEYQGIECDGCRMRDICTKSKKGRILHRYNNQEYVDTYKEKMKNEIAQEMIKRRKTIIEHTFGTIKCWMGKIPLLLSGREKVATEINIYATAYNIKRLTNMVELARLTEEIKGYNWAIA